MRTFKQRTHSQRIVIRNDTDWRDYKWIARPVFDNSKTGERTTALATDPAVKEIQWGKEQRMKRELRDKWVAALRSVDTRVSKNAL